jgi:hypothetical protein
MYYLLFMDELRRVIVSITPVLLLCLSAYLIWSPRASTGWKKTVLRTSGSLLLVATALICVVLSFGALMGADAATEHFVSRSATGAKVALLSHTSLRDSSATRVAFIGKGCCRRYIAYDYQGDGDDYTGAGSVSWIDDRHLIIRYAVDPSGFQTCRTQLADVQILCEPQPTPVFDHKR